MDSDAMSTFLAIAIIILVISVPVGLVLKWVHDHPCIESHREMVYHHSWTSYTPIYSNGKLLTMIPVYHEGYNSLDTICDKRK